MSVHNERDKVVSCVICEECVSVSLPYSVPILYNVPTPYSVPILYGAPFYTLLRVCLMNGKTLCPVRFP